MQDDASRLYELVKQGLTGIGYTERLIQEDYEFADILGHDYSVSTLPLAAFAQEPPSYRNACFGVVFANGGQGVPSVEKYRSLGAPQILELHQDHLVRWKMTMREAPEPIERTMLEEVPRLFERNKDDWSPRRILRAKSEGVEFSRQLDFFDRGLLPLLEHQAREKLDSLLSDTVELAVQEFRRESEFNDQYYPPLFRLLFRLIAAKVLADRGCPGNWLADDPRPVISAVQDFYFQGTSPPETVLEHRATQLTAWGRIKQAFHFQNLSVDSLAYVYENTLVAKDTRRLYGIHSTPPAIAEYMTRQLPFEDLEQNERRVFEPFAGHGVFLIAAMQRMRELLPTEMTAEQRHRYFVNMLSGIELDEFAREVARLSLMLADYPNPDGWRLYGGDALESTIFDQELNTARIVLCNPPFGDFDPEERARYKGLTSARKPAAILARVMQAPPDLLGFVLPRSFIMGRGYRQVRSSIGATYSSLELVALPDKVFRHSDTESVLLLASKKGQRFHKLKTGEVAQKDLGNFYVSHQLSRSAYEEFDSSESLRERGMWLPALQEVWNSTSRMKCLGDLAEVHRGIEYNVPFREKASELVSDTVRPGFIPGVHRVRNTIEPFSVRNTVYLNVSPDLMRTSAYEHPWSSRKLIVNAGRRTRGAWTITAAIDYEGVVCYQNFHGIWPSSSMSLETFAAILNGPIANAFVATREGKRDVQIQTLLGIPFPDIDPGQDEAVASLVREYVAARSLWLSESLPEERAHDICARLLRLVDAEVLRAYDLAPRTERVLLDHFSGQRRPGPVVFREYFPDSFKPWIPLHRYLSDEIGLATARSTLSRLPVIDDPIISAALEDLYSELPG